MSIKDNIRMYRKQMRLTQEETAKKAGLSRTYFADVERGRYNPSVQILRKISEALNVKIEDLLNEDGDVKEDIEADTKTNEKNNFVDILIDQLIDDGIIRDVSNMDEQTEEIILNVIKTQIAIKLKKRTN